MLDQGWQVVVVALMVGGMTARYRGSDRTRRRIPLLGGGRIDKEKERGRARRKRAGEVKCM